MPRLPWSVAAFLVVSLASLAQGEEVEHPIYRSWARHKVGTSITVRSTTSGDGLDVETTLKHTLVELTDTKVVIETVMTSNSTGSQIDSSPSKYTYSRMFPLLPGVKKEDIGKPSNKIASGEETITIAGKEYKAQWYDGKSQTEGGEALARTWMSDEVPGKLLKAVGKVKNSKRVNTVELIEIKTP